MRYSRNVTGFLPYHRMLITIVVYLCYSRSMFQIQHNLFRSICNPTHAWYRVFMSVTLHILHTSFPKIVWWTSGSAYTCNRIKLLLVWRNAPALAHPILAKWRIHQYIGSSLAQVPAPQPFATKPKGNSGRIWYIYTLTARFMGPTWAHLGPTGPRWPHVDPWILLSGYIYVNIC